MFINYIDFENAFHKFHHFILRQK